MNVLYVGNAMGFQNADRFYLLPQKLVNGMVRIGHNVYIYNDRDYSRYSNPFRTSRFGVGAANRKLLEICRSFQPKLVILAHCEMIQNETLAEVREICQDVRIIYRNVDPLCDASNIKKINNRMGHVDGVFITTAGEALKQFSHPDSFICHIPNLVDSSVEVSQSFSCENCDIDLLFAGHVYRDIRDHRLNDIKKLVAELGDINFRVIGVLDNSPCIFGQDYMDILARSKMGLCYNKTNEYYLYASDRIAQYLGSGLLVFINKNHGFSDILGKDGIVEYDSIEELVGKVRYFREHDRERRTIAANGWQRAHDFFDCRKVAQYMIERAFNQPLSRDYHWPLELY
ncbi:MAG TPA: glycosyltransferase [Gammaproteobacteria bacterium]|nr:glycosyltransferase [Gammaproteobacteria bacterium]